MQTILVLANRTAVGTQITQHLFELKQSDPDLSVVVALPATPRTHRGIKVDALGRSIRDPYGLDRAYAQLNKAVAAIGNLGVKVGGWVGPADPMACVRRAVNERTFDRIVVSTLPPGSSRWLAMDLPHRIERRYDIPVDHVVGHPIVDDADTQPAEGPVTILLVEDQKADIELTRRALEQSDVEVDLMVAKHGAEALAAVRTYGAEGLDLVLLDLNMPVLDGHEFLEQVGRELDLQTLNVAILTTSTSDRDRERAHALGAGSYLVKDQDFDAFAATLGSVVNEQRER